MKNKEFDSTLSIQDIPHNGMSINDAIHKIEEYGGNYDPNTPGFDIWDQLLACEALYESKPVSAVLEENKHSETSVSGSVNGMSNDTHKQHVNFELTSTKQVVLDNLLMCNYRTPPIKVANLLKKLFEDYPSKDGHWLYVAQKWNPRAINRTISDLRRQHDSGEVTIQNPAAYFTHLIKFRKKRKK